MGVGRREFIRLTSLALAGLKVNPLQSVITSEDIYINKKLGILFHKPSEWGFIKVKDFGKLKNEQILGNGWNEYKEEVWEDLGEPVCIATKYYQNKPENKGVFSPTITLNITPKVELTDLNAENFEEIISMSNYGASLILKNFKVLTDYKSYYQSGNKFYEYDSEYEFEHVDLTKPLKVELKSLKTEHNGFYYDFNCHQSKSQNQIAEKEFDDFKKTIRLL